MSLALPYPSMVFVPLDVLTADEMNHIVANYEFIANQFPITSDNIDWTTIKGNIDISEYVNTSVIRNINRARIMTSGGIATLSLNLRVRAIPGNPDSTTLVTLPAELRPTYVTALTGFQNSAENLYMFQLNADGTLTTRSQITDYNIIEISGAWVLP